MLLFCLCCSTVTWGKKKPSQTITRPDGTPIRKVYIQSALPDAAASVATQMAQDTCLTTVSSAKEADAVLDLSVALPTAEGGLPTPNIFGMPAEAQTLGNAKDSKTQNTNVSCGDSKGAKGCVTTSNGPAGDLKALPGVEGPVNAAANYDISLVSPQNNAQELWSPEAHSKRPWTDQLRVAAGCPVCPRGHFDRRKYKSYRAWIEDCFPLPQQTGP